mmetsp:Transcript_12362/g.17109  ORF Transcript_12362/g.17109 Transcript_12362/m.17109 type:complete len:209 (-) Transcript_12362:995-1621(-)
MSSCLSTGKSRFFSLWFIQRVQDTTPTLQSPKSILHTMPLSAFSSLTTPMTCPPMAVMFSAVFLSPSMPSSPMWLLAMLNRVLAGSISKFWQIRFKYSIDMLNSMASPIMMVGSRSNLVTGASTLTTTTSAARNILRIFSDADGGNSLSRHMMSPTNTTLDTGLSCFTWSAFPSLRDSGPFLRFGFCAEFSPHSRTRRGYLTTENSME